MLLALSAAGWRWGPAAWHRAQFLDWQRQCMNYTMPARLHLWERDPAKAAALLSLNQDYATMPRYKNWAKFYPRCLWEWESRGLRSVVDLRCPVLLLHELRSPGGNRRLVVIYSEQYGGWSGHHEVFYDVYVPAGIFSDPSKVGKGVAYDAVRPTFSIAFATTQIDPADPSRFTINWETGSLFIPRSGVFDGQLMDDDRIVITERNGSPTP